MQFSLFFSLGIEFLNAVTVRYQPLFPIVTRHQYLSTEQEKDKKCSRTHAEERWTFSLGRSVIILFLFFVLQLKDIFWPPGALLFKINYSAFKEMIVIAFIFYCVFLFGTFSLMFKEKI